MFVRGKAEASIKGNQLVIDCDDPKELAKSLGFQYSPLFKTEMTNTIKAFLGEKGNISIEGMKDKLGEMDGNPTTKRYLNILNEIKPQVKIDGVYYNYHVYHQGNMTMVELSKMHDLDEILYKKVEALPDTKEVRKIQKKKEKIKGGGVSYDNLKKYYSLNEKLERIGHKS